MTLKTLKIFILIMGLFSLFGCGDKPSKKIKQNLSINDTISFDELLKKSYDYLNNQQDLCFKTYKISDYQNWYYDQLTGQLTFSDNGITKLIIDYEDIGSFSFISNSWLWAWDNPHVEENIKQQIKSVKDFGVKRNFTKLVDAKWKAEEVDGWEMSAIACYLLNGKGVYRVPTNNGKVLSFMMFKKITWADTTHLK
jgi:hypothetical protein